MTDNRMNLKFRIPIKSQSDRTRYQMCDKYYPLLCPNNIMVKETNIGNLYAGHVPA